MVSRLFIRCNKYQADAPAVLGARYAVALDVGINPTTGEIDCKMNYDPAYDPSNYYYYYGPPTPYLETDCMR